MSQNISGPWYDEIYQSHRQRVITASLDGRIVHNYDTFSARYPAYSSDYPSTWYRLRIDLACTRKRNAVLEVLAVTNLMSSQGGKFNER